MKLSEMMDVLLAALIVELRADGNTEADICAAALYPGDSVPIDYVECGLMAWVRLVESSPTTGFPNAGFGNQRGTVCWWNLLHTVEMGVMRRAPMAEEILSTMDLPDDSEHTAASHKQYDDMELMNRAIKAAKQDIEELLPVNYTPVGPSGGAVGGTWAITIGDG